MYDIEKIRKNPEWLDDGLKKRGIAPLAATILELDEQRRELQTAVQQNLARRNELSRQIGDLKKNGGNADALMQEVANLKEQIQKDEAQEALLAGQLQDYLVSNPNVPADDVPVGADEADNVEVSRFMEPTAFAFEPKDHVTLGEGLGLMDFATAAKMSGARFVVTKGLLSRLERAVALFGLDLLTGEYGYTEITAPYLVNSDTMFGTGNLPKFGEESFQTTGGHWLIPTSEVSMTNLVSGDILDPVVLPLRFTGFTPCFRSEAGSAGKDTRGMIRQHQFFKVEQVVVTTPEKSAEEHERMVAIAEEGLRRLQLPYRKVLLCSGDMGFASQKTYDIETWIPTQNTYRETMSCSNCGDFQARRMKTRFKQEGDKKTAYVHTLNATLFATGRILVAIMENYQQEDGSIRVPDVLRPYMNGVEVIGK